MKFFAPLAFLSVVLLSLASCSGGQWSMSENGKFQYNIISEQPNPVRIDYGDSVWLDYQMTFNDTVVISSYETGASISLTIPTKMHRNAFEEPLVLVGEGDSLRMKVKMKDGGAALNAFAAHLNPEDEVVFSYRIHKVIKRAEIEAIRENTYLTEKGFKDVESMKAEQERVRGEAANSLVLLDESIQKLKDNSINHAKVDSADMYFVVHEEGEGAKLKEGDIVYVYFILKLADGKTILDNTAERGDRFVYQLGSDDSLIPVWQKALTSLKKGSKASFLVPAALGYGEEGSLPRVPKNADLAWYVEVVEVKYSE